MEKMENFQENEKQIIEGAIGNSLDGWHEKLPADITPDMVDLFLGNTNSWHWHLKSEYIKNEQEKEKYEAERNAWP